MKIEGNAIRPGNVIRHKDELWVAVKIKHTQPGKGGAYLQVELRGVRDGTKLNERFRSSQAVERVRLDQKEHQFLYAEGDQLVFMDTESYDQVQIDRALIGDGATFLQDGMMVTIESFEGMLIDVELPETVVMEVTETEPAIKGQTATASYKPAILEGGVRVMVPPFVGPGERVVVNTADGTYSKRAER